MTVIVARNRTPEGTAALRAGVREALGREEELHVFEIDRTSSDPEGRLEEPFDEEASAALRGSELDVTRLASREHVDDPVAELLEHADATDASLIVLGVRRRSRVGKFLLGSTAQQILLDAKAEVLAVKAG